MIRKEISRIETITPARAEELLGAKHMAQRNLRESLAEKYAKMMRDGNWRMSTLRVGVLDTDVAKVQLEELLDGQHRMKAVVLSGKEQRFNVLYQYADDRRDLIHEYATIDTGLSRRVNDAQAMLGIHTELGIDKDLLASVNAALVIIATGFDFSQTRALADHFGINTLEERAMLPLRVQNEAITYGEMMRHVHPTERARFRNASVVALFIATVRFNEEARQLWFDAAKNDKLERGTPAHNLHRIVCSESLNKPVAWITRACASCWNNFVTGRGSDIVSPKVELAISILKTPWADLSKMSVPRKAEIRKIFTDKPE